ncbi:MAG TPA: HAMP domain-containing sensor histidine kinase [bacterium]|nr:HAMP domain-containing sensor histidine kinase [bacterium]
MRLAALRGKRPGLPARLALLQGVVVTATLVFVIVLTARLAHVYLTRELDYRLASTVRSFQEGPAQHIAAPQDLAREASTWLADRGATFDETIVVRGLEGLVYASAGGLDLRNVVGARELLLADRVVWRILDGPQGRVRAVAVPLMLEGRQIGTLVVAASKDRLSATTRAVAVRSVAAGGVGLLLALAAGYTLMRSSLRPLARMLAQIETIHATADLRGRVGPVAGSDEIGRLARAFDRMLERLEGSFRAQQRFIADASHELRTPLAVAQGHLELLRDELEAARRHPSLAAAAEELSRMARIVDELLLLARLDEGMPVDVRPVEAELVLREAVLRALRLAPRRIAVEAESGLFVLADPERLLQVLTNLLSNAAIHGGEEAAIVLRARCEGDRALIEVADSGPGIPPEDLPHVFQRFYRGSRARSTAGGVGLGLAIVASLVRAMGGEVAVQSAAGRGTTFRVVLPLSPAPGGKAGARSP